MKSYEFISQIVSEDFPGLSTKEIINRAYLIQYFINKMKSVDGSSKTRGSFGSIYPIYTLVEDYINNGFDKNNNYNKYDGAQFSIVFNRQRELPFGEKLQNHGFNNRVNDDFKKYFSKYGVEDVPILRNLETQRYWINDNLLIININGTKINIANTVLKIVNKYIELKLNNFNEFFNKCVYYKENYLNEKNGAISFIKQQLNPNTDARIFEIVSFVILKYYYLTKTVYIGFERDNIKSHNLELFKTGRTNANDGGIDFIMEPLGRVYQVTEVLDFRKYFLDIDKLNKFAITFIVKTMLTPEIVMSKIKEDAATEYPNNEVLQRYLECFEEIITIPTLLNILGKIIDNEKLGDMLDELILQCKIEYNINDNEEE